MPQHRVIAGKGSMSESRTTVQQNEKTTVFVDEELVSADSALPANAGIKQGRQ
jgi:hypothetical protein